MKKVFLPLLLLATGCHKKCDTEPTAALAEDEIEVETLGRNPDCGVAQVVAKDQAKVEQLIGKSAYAPTYLALKLDTALWVRKNRTLYVRIRKPLNAEYVLCTMWGPGYQSFVVTSARVKP
ncbi:MAG TPA: hypothetical protein VFO93_19470 [Hymenobacter sp.]|uniref:hypothetical protein n=1 Tax=Hymenobacter sp. TaxID=1898978 RepID=UPI002D80DC48|nr:hypothetical protein [Hymenobacter sp.]HET9505734.1 hypothetical protein [Hymenobacter sp.]